MPSAKNSTQLRPTIYRRRNREAKELVILRVVVDNLIVRLVESGGQVFLCKGQTNSIGNSLTKRTWTNCKKKTE